MRILLPLLVLATASLLPAQTKAAVSNYGRGCQLPSSPPPLIRATKLPKIGTTFNVRFTGPNSVTPVSEDQPVLLTGVQSASIAVPPISTLQPAGCKLFLVPLIYTFMPRSGSRFQGEVNMAIPNDKSLIGLVVYQQFASIYRNCRTATCIDQMIRVSDGLKITVGV